MVVSEVIGNEAILFGTSVLCGMGLVLTYDILRIIRRLIPHGNIWIGIEDVCYWIFCTVHVFLLLYLKNDGRMRGFCFLGILLGGLFYASLLSRGILKIVVPVLDKIGKVLGKILGTLGRPPIKLGKKIFSFIRKQLKKLYKAIRMGLCKL